MTTTQTIEKAIIQLKGTSLETLKELAIKACKEKHQLIFKSTMQAIEKYYGGNERDITGDLVKSAVLNAR